MRAAVAACVLCAACSSDPTLSVKGDGATALVVGQRASLKVTVGGDSSELEARSFTLTDAAKRVLRQGAPGLELVQPSAWEVGFAVPAGVAPGPATLSVSTRLGPAFNAALTLERVVAVRDSAGKVWLSALTSAEAVAAYAELAPDRAGSGAGPLAVSASGHLLAIAAQSRELRLAALELPLRTSPPLSLPADATALAFTARGAVLVGTASGLYVVEPPNAVNDKTPLRLAPGTVLGEPTLAVAVDRAGRRGVALVRADSPPRYLVVPLDLGAATPAVVARLALGWPFDAGASLAVAIGPDGGCLVASSKQDKVALLAPGAGAPAELALPAGHGGPAGVASAAPALFQIASRAGRSLVALRLDGGKASFDPPLDLGLAPESGDPIALASSAHGELVVLLARELYLIPPGAKGRALKLPALFVDKAKSDPGVALAVQP